MIYIGEKRKIKEKKEHVLEDWGSFERKKEREKEKLQPRLSRYAPRCFWNSNLYLIFPRV